MAPGRLVFAALSLTAMGLAACLPRARVGAWVVRDRLTRPEAVRQVCRTARAHGLDLVLVQVRGRGDAYYASRRAPRAEPLDGAPPGFDPLAEVLSACGDVPVHAWVNVYYLWGGLEPPASPDHPVRAHPEWILRDDEGRSVAGYNLQERALGWIEGIYADPSAPGYREYFVDVVRELADRYPVAGIHLDFVRYPGIRYGQGGLLGERFRDVWGLDPRLLPPELRTPDAQAWLSGRLPPGDRVLATLGLVWADWRAAQVTALVRGVRAALRREHPGMTLSAAVVPDSARAFVEKGQDWRTWAAEGLVDLLFPMTYFGGPERVQAQVHEAVTRTRPWGTAVWAGMGAYIKAPEVVFRDALAARRQGAEGLCLFDWGTLLDRPGGPGPWVRAVRGRRWRAPPAPRLERPLPATRGGRWLAAVAERAWGGRLPRVADPGRAFDRRWEELEAAAPVLARVARELEGAEVEIPAWVDLQGIFRYVDPLDGGVRRLDQLGRAREARDRALAGEPFDRLAREMSQGGTARLGGFLGRRFLYPGTPGYEALVRAAPGDVVGPVEVDNGFWVYRVRARGGGRTARFGQAPWPVRRQVFRRTLNRVLAEGPQGAGGAS